MKTDDDLTTLDERVEAAVAQEMVTAACEQIEAEIKDGIIPVRICHECQSVFPIYSWVPHGNVCYSEEVGSVFFECDDCRFPEEEHYNDLDAILDEDAYLDGTSGTHASWLCATCGDPAYDCGCEDAICTEFIDDEIDRKAELMKHGRL